MTKRTTPASTTGSRLGMTRRRLLARGAALAAAPAFLHLAAARDLAPAEAAAAPTLRFGITEADLGTADPHYAAATQDRALVDMLFNGLLRFKPGDVSVFESDLAAALPRASVVAGKQVWTFPLRHGVMWHPSDKVPAYELTSDDVVFSLRKAADKARSAYSAQYVGMDFTAIDPHTVSVTLDTSLSGNLFFPLVAAYSGGFILSKRNVEAYGLDGIKAHPVGTGPFMFQRYSPKDRMTLAANPRYFRGAPHLGGVDFRYMAELFSRELGLRSGQLDAISGGTDDAWITRVQGIANLRVDVFGVGESTLLYMNQTVKPLDRKEVRQAIAYALDRRALRALISTKACTLQIGPLAPFLVGALTDAEVASRGLDYKTDPDKARKLLAEGGVPNGFSLDLVTSQLESYSKAYEGIQAQLAKVGIKINLRVVDHPTYHALIRKDVNPLVLYIAYRPTAEIYLRSFYYSQSTVVTGAHPDTNFIHYSATDDLIDRARGRTNAAQQVALWKEAQIRILQDMVAYPMYYTNQVYARTARVKYGHPLKSEISLYPGIDEKTRLG